MKKSYPLKPFQAEERVSSFNCEVEYRNAGLLRLEFLLEGQVDLLQINEEAIGTFQWGQDLWKETCFEMFLAFPGTTQYWEWNFSTISSVCCYSFSDYRKHLFLDPIFTQTFGALVGTSYKLTSTELRKSCELNLNCLPNFSWHLLGHSELDLSLCSVLKFKSGDTSYWTQRHSIGKADFHKRETWANFPLKAFK